MYTILLVRLSRSLANDLGQNMLDDYGINLQGFHLQFPSGFHLSFHMIIPQKNPTTGVAFFHVFPHENSMISILHLLISYSNAKQMDGEQHVT